MQGKLVFMFRIGLFLLLLSVASCAMGGDLQRRYVISHASDEAPYEPEVEFEEN